MGRVRPYFVVILSPDLQNLAGLPNAGEQCLVEQLVSQLAIKALHKPILLRLTWRNVMPLDLTGCLPCQHRLTGHLGAIIAHDELRLAIDVDELIQLPRHPSA